MQEKQINLGRATESPRREAMKHTLPLWIQLGQQKQSFSLVTGTDKTFLQPTPTNPREHTAVVLWMPISALQLAMDINKFVCAA